ncbi:hypothetical protein RchiOBHm_Chr3g0492301 [Rosa chinensis]|uniref:Uncharacterized protein n=1 Tax=Rosa chinensis TaxID=74649 RepID=A0A2P6RGG2_ROSCH|nr:hypothetical protein RchiOBHm_Chr3g0492301 [Rosa chinensis]
MHIRRAIIICSSIPLMGCVLTTLVHLFSSSQSDSEDDVMRGREDEVTSSSNATAQKHFRQLQCIRTA